MQRLTCLSHLSFRPYDHQINTALRVLEEMGGRALLADEVGLGKTIEAGLVMKELVTRQKIKKMLILAPASLGEQWCNELREKFDLPFWVNKREFGWEYFDYCIASLDLAKRPEHRQYIQGIEYDVVVVDEAHRLKNQSSANWQLVKSIRTRHLLLLTATPLQNDLKELYNLVTLVNPELFGDYSSFQKTFMVDKRVPKNPEELQELLSRVMIRHQRHECQLELPERRVSLISVELSPAEEALYQAVSNFVRREYNRRRADRQSILGLLTLQREICSSSYAALKTIQQLGLWELDYLAAQVKDNQKAVMVENFLAQNPEKTIIFTEFLETQYYLAQRLSRKGYKVLFFNGQLSRWQREWVKDLFRRQDFQVLISTEAGGEGINLQFCHQLINYDLPWNPMKLEQRIGRVHRLGQENTVYIYNLCTRNTIEEHLLHLLYQKLQLFEEAIGPVPVVVAGIEREKTWEKEILEALLAEAEENQPAAAPQPSDWMASLMTPASPVPAWT